MRVLHVINSIEIGGAETFLLRLIQQQQQLGYSCAVLVLDETNNDSTFLDYWKLKSGVAFVSKYKEAVDFKMRIIYKLDWVLRFFFGMSFLDTYKANLKKRYYQKLQHQFRFDIVNSHLLSSDLFVLRTLSKFIDIPWVITSQGCYNDYSDVNIVSQLIKRINGLTYVAEKNLKIFKATALPLPQNIKLIYNGLAMPDDKTVFKRRADLGLTDDDFVVGQISRSIESKGMEVSIKAVLKLVKSGYDNLKLLITGPENEYYNMLRERYRHERHIIFTGVAINPIEYVGLFDVGLLPTYFPSESCPSSIIEYISCGKPVIAFDNGEISNMLQSESGAAGIVISAVNEEGVPDYNVFADAIQVYMNDSTRLKHDSETALKAFEKFDIRNTALQYQEVYQHAIKHFSLSQSISDAA